MWIGVTHGAAFLTGGAMALQPAVAIGSVDGVASSSEQLREPSMDADDETREVGALPGCYLIVMQNRSTFASATSLTRR